MTGERTGRCESGHAQSNSPAAVATVLAGGIGGGVAEEVDLHTVRGEGNERRFGRGEVQAEAALGLLRILGG